MDLNSPETTIQPDIEEPNLDNLDPWLEKYITIPFRGYEDKTHPDGTHFSRQEVLEASRNQLRILANDRGGVLDYKNRIRTKNGGEPISQEQYDQNMIEDFMGIALDLSTR